jgi:hypothetical protein
MLRRSSSPNGSTLLAAPMAVAADAAKAGADPRLPRDSLASSISMWPAPIDIVAPCGSADKRVSVQRITPVGWQDGRREDRRDRPCRLS